MLTAKQLKIMIHSNFPNEKASLIAKALKNKVFIKDDTMYCVNSNIVYIAAKKVENKMIKIVSTLLENSFKDLEDVDRTDIQAIKGWSYIFANSNIKTYFPQLEAELTNDKMQFDDYKDEMHFINGVYNLRTGKFYPRELGKHYITYSIEHAYKKPQQKTMDKVRMLVRNIYPDDDDLFSILMLLGAALTGRFTRIQEALFLLGEGSSGKSTIMIITQYSIGLYVQELKDDTFSLNNSKRDKIYNTYRKCRYIRISWVNEMKDFRIDDSAYKAFINGKLQTTLLFVDCQESFEHRSIAVFTANSMPNVKIDTGVARRIRSLTHIATFTSIKNGVDENKHIYLKDINFMEQFEEEEMKLAWFQILADHAKKWLGDEEIIYSDNFNNTTANVIASNDTMKDFVDVALICT